MIIISIVENRSKFNTKKGMIHFTLSQRQIYSGDVISKMRLNQLNVLLELTLKSKIWIYLALQVFSYMIIKYGISQPP